MTRLHERGVLEPRPVPGVGDARRARTRAGRPPTPARRLLRTTGRGRRGRRARARRARAARGSRAPAGRAPRRAEELAAARAGCPGRSAPRSRRTRRAAAGRPRRWRGPGRGAGPRASRARRPSRRRPAARARARGAGSFRPAMSGAPFRTATRSTRCGSRAAQSSPATPQSCTQRRTRSSASASSSRGSQRAQPSTVKSRSPRLPLRPKPGRSTAMPPPRSRKGSQSSALVGTPWRYRTGTASSPAPEDVDGLLVELDGLVSMLMARPPVRRSATLAIEDEVFAYPGWPAPDARPSRSRAAHPGPARRALRRPAHAYRTAIRSRS